jgi:uncharacterized lipoprotein YehR (DUF1307 family)
MSLLRVIVVCCVVALLGCGDGGTTVKPPDTTAKDQVKQYLENIAETGAGGSEMGAIMEELKKLEESDPALAAELQEDAKTFMSTQNSPEQLKAKAKEMIEKLDGGTGG